MVDAGQGRPAAACAACMRSRRRALLGARGMAPAAPPPQAHTHGEQSRVCGSAGLHCCVCMWGGEGRECTPTTLGGLRGLMRGLGVLGLNERGTRKSSAFIHAC